MLALFLPAWRVATTWGRAGLSRWQLRVQRSRGRDRGDGGWGPWPVAGVFVEEKARRQVGADSDVTGQILILLNMNITC